MSAPSVSVTPASPDVNVSGVTNRRLSYQAANSTHQRMGSGAGMGGSAGGASGYGSAPYAQSHLRSGSIPYVPDTPAK